MKFLINWRNNIIRFIYTNIFFIKLNQLIRILYYFNIMKYYFNIYIFNFLIYYLKFNNLQILQKKIKKIHFGRYNWIFILSILYILYCFVLKFNLNLIYFINLIHYHKFMGNWKKLLFIKTYLLNLKWFYFQTIKKISN